MKEQTLFEEMSAICKSLDIQIRKETGNFRSGVCIIDNHEVVILNKTASLSVMNTILALTLEKHINSIYIKPAIREFVEKESLKSNINEYIIEIDESLKTEKIKKNQKNLN